LNRFTNGRPKTGINAEDKFKVHLRHVCETVRVMLKSFDITYHLQFTSSDKETCWHGTNSWV